MHSALRVPVDFFLSALARQGRNRGDPANRDDGGRSLEPKVGELVGVMCTYAVLVV